MRIQYRSFFCFFLLVPSISFAQIRLEGSSLVIENEKFTKTIHISRKHPGKIYVASLLDRLSGEELLFQPDSTAWFELVIGNQLVKSTDPVWQFQGHKIRMMDNGGEEVAMTFTGKSGNVKNLQLVILNQLFPSSTLVREQLTLQTTASHSFALNKWEGKLHFVFPQYQLKSTAPANSTEIRIAKWGGELLDSIYHSSYDERRFDEGKYHNLAQAHMFHPEKREYALQEGERRELKGPFGIIQGQAFSWLTAYEHASQDNLADPTILGGLSDQSGKISKISIEELQRPGGTLEQAEERNQRLHFLTIEHKQPVAGSVISSVNILRGGYFDGELITRQKPYSSIWTASAFYRNDTENQPREIMHDYMLKWICENQASRKSEFYYNTWGMQREEASQIEDVLGVITYDRMFQEIDNAAELGVDIFVLDAGWENGWGVWKPHSKRLKDGFKPILQRLQEKGLKMGLWLSPLGIAQETERYRAHPEWVIRDEQGNPVPSQLNYPVFDFVSGFYDLFIQDSKWLIDQGVRFFKWDAINTFYPFSTESLHGNDQHSKEEIIARYGYLLPIFVKKAMAELTAYNPEVVIEIDLTEDRRSLVGLAMLCEGKVFWMNNGASGYGDYSQYRAKSMRTIANKFAGIVPLELFTYANYPHNAFPYFSQRYNVNSSLVAGRGFWGNLNLMTQEQRLRVGQVVNKAKRVLPYISETITEVQGIVGDSPEIYTTVNVESAAGQIIAFSGTALDYNHHVNISGNNLLAVLNNAYRLIGDSLILPFQFPMPDATREAFVLTNNGTGISIVASTSWLEDVQVEGGNMHFTVGAPGEHLVYWPTEGGKPSINSSDEMEYEITENSAAKRWEVQLKNFTKNSKIEIGR